MKKSLYTNNDSDGVLANILLSIGYDSIIAINLDNLLSKTLYLKMLLCV